MKRWLTTLLLTGLLMGAPAAAQNDPPPTPDELNAPSGDLVTLNEVEEGDTGVTGEDVGLVDSPTDPTVTGSPTGADAELQAALELIIKMVSDVTFIPGAAALVIALTAILKRFVPINAAYIALGLQVIVWVAWILVKNAGYELQFQGWIDSLTTIVSGFVGFVLSTGAATKGYNALVRANAPILGDTRASIEAQHSAQT